MLKLRIRPEGKLYVGSDGGWIKNVGARPIDLLISDALEVERDNRIPGKSEGEEDERAGR